MLRGQDMEGHGHAALVRLFREEPTLVGVVLAECLGQSIPANLACIAASPDLSEAAPVELRADGIFLFANVNGRPERAVILEVQSERDDRKEFTWPLYAMQTRARHECPAIVLVVAFDRAVAARARRPIMIDEATVWRALVLGPDDVPRIESEEAMKISPSLGILSALAHGHDLEDFQVVKAALNGLPGSSLAPDIVGYYLQLIDSAFGPVLRAAMERAMQSGEVIQPGPIGQFYLKQGRTEGLRQSLSVILKARRLNLTPLQQAKLDECTDHGLLDRWVERASTATSAEEIFGLDE